MFLAQKASSPPTASAPISTVLAVLHTDGLSDQELSMLRQPATSTVTSLDRGVVKVEHARSSGKVRRRVLYAKSLIGCALNWYVYVCF